MRDFSGKPVLDGRRIVLRPVAESDAGGLADLVADPEGRRLTGTHGDLAADLAALRAWYGSRHQNPDRLDLAITERSTGEYAGEIVLNELDRPNRSCSLRIALRRHYRDRGLGSEAVRLVLGHAFSTVGLHRIQLEVYAFNLRALAVYERVGFVREGVRRHALYWDGEYTDSIVMAILAPDWFAANRQP